MVRRAGHGAHAIVARRKTPGHGRREASIAIADVIDPLEEDERPSVHGLGGRQRIAQALDRDMRVADNAAAGECLRRRVATHLCQCWRHQERDMEKDILGGVWIGETTSNETLHLKSKAECGVGFELAGRSGAWEGDDA